jgi:hypothetical protein
MIRHHGQSLHDVASLKGASMRDSAVHHRVRLIAVVAVLSVLASPISGSAQTPAREGNESDFKDWQPTRPEVSAEERAAGIRQSPAQRNAEDNELKLMYQDLMGDERASPAVAGQGAPR